VSLSVIFAKTTRGAAEISGRSSGLSPMARRVLIMIDGRRTEAELEQVVRDGQLEAVLTTLRTLGMIEECGVAEFVEPTWTDGQETIPLDVTSLDFDLGVSRAASARSAPPPTLRVEIMPGAEAVVRPVAPTVVAAPSRPAPREPEGPSLEETKRVAVRALFERLGPYGEAPAARIQECKTPAALREQIKHACQRITTFRGASAAREYLAAIGLQ